MVVIVGSLIGSGGAAWGQSSSDPSGNSSGTASSGNAQTGKQAKHSLPAPPRSDSVDAGALEEGESSSKDTQVDLSAPSDDAKAHPKSGDALMDASVGSGNADVSEFHPWDPHKAAKDVEVGDFYFRRKNYVGAEGRYREALVYKENDAVATFRLAECLEKMNRPEESRQEYESYLRILPHGPQAEDAKKAIERLKGKIASVR